MVNFLPPDLQGIRPAGVPQANPAYVPPREMTQREAERQFVLIPPDEDTASQGGMEDLGNAWQRGSLQFADQSDYYLNQLGLLSNKDFALNRARRQIEAGMAPMSEGQAGTINKLMQQGSQGDWLGMVGTGLTDPGAIFATTTESLPSAMPGIVGGVLSGLLTHSPQMTNAVVGAGAALPELPSSAMEYIDNLPEVRNGQVSWEDAWNDPATRLKANQYGLLRAGIVGGGAMLGQMVGPGSSGLVGGLLARFGKAGLGAMAARTGTELLTGAGIDAATEALAEQATTGKVDPFQVFMEGAAGLPGEVSTMGIDAIQHHMEERAARNVAGEDIEPGAAEGVPPDGNPDTVDITVPYEAPPAGEDVQMDDGSVIRVPAEEDIGAGVAPGEPEPTLPGPDDLAEAEAANLTMPGEDNGIINVDEFEPGSSDITEPHTQDGVTIEPGQPEQQQANGSEVINVDQFEPGATDITEPHTQDGVTIEPATPEHPATGEVSTQSTAREQRDIAEQDLADMGYSPEDVDPNNADADVQEAFDRWQEADRQVMAEEGQPNVRKPKGAKTQALAEEPLINAQRAPASVEPAPSAFGGEVEPEPSRATGGSDATTERNQPEAAPAAKPTEPASPQEALYQRAVNSVQEKGTVSTAQIQRDHGVGYEQASQIVERMQKEGIVSAPDKADNYKRTVTKAKKRPATGAHTEPVTLVSSKAVRNPGEGTEHHLTFSDGSQHIIDRAADGGSTGGVTGWVEYDRDQPGSFRYHGETKAEAIQSLLDKKNKRVAEAKAATPPAPQKPPVEPKPAPSASPAAAGQTKPAPAPKAKPKMIEPGRGERVYTLTHKAPDGGRTQTQVTATSWQRAVAKAGLKREDVTKIEMGGVNEAKPALEQEVPKQKALADGGPVGTLPRINAAEPKPEPKTTAKEEVAEDRGKGGKLSPYTRKTNYNTGLAPSDEVWVDLKQDPKKASNFPALKQIKMLVDHIKDRFAFKNVTAFVEGNLIKGFDAIQQLKRAYNSMRWMANALDMPREGMSLGGRLTLALIRQKSTYFGAYDPNSHTIYMPGRSNSFAHEWFHAFDHYLFDMLKRTGKQSALLSQFARAKGLDVSNSVEEAFAAFVNAVWYDEGALAAKAQALEQEANKLNKATGQPTTKAVAARAQLDRLYAGNSRLAKMASKLRITSKSQGDYYAQVHELMARVFEGYVNMKMLGEGATNTDFTTKDEAVYLNGADERLAAIYPDASDRGHMYLALDRLFEQVRAADLMGKGRSEKPSGTGMLDPREWDKVVVPQDQKNILQHTVDAAIALAHPLKTLAAITEELRNSVSGIAVGKAIQTAYKYGVKVPFYTARGHLTAARKRAAALGLSKLTDYAWHLIGTDTGAGTLQTPTLEGIRHKMTNENAGYIGGALRANGFPEDGLDGKRWAGARKIIRAIMLGQDPNGATQQHYNVAAALRQVMDKMYDRLQTMGHDIGYVMEGYLQRIYNHTAVRESPVDFTQKGAQVYAEKYDQEVNRMEHRDFMALVKATAERLVPLNESKMWQAEREAVAKAVRALSQARLAQNRAAIQAATQAYGKARSQLQAAVRMEWAKLSAQDFTNAIVHGEAVTMFNSGVGKPSFMRSRSLPKSADTLFEDYLETDPVRLAVAYASEAANTLAWNETVGSKGGITDMNQVLARPENIKRVNANAASRAKYDPNTVDGQVAIIRDLTNPVTDNRYGMALSQLEKAGLGMDDIASFSNVFLWMTGQRGGHGSGSGSVVLGGVSNALYAYTNFRMMNKAITANLTEPVAMLLRTGSADATRKAFASYLSGMLRVIGIKPKGIERYHAIAKAIYLIAEPLHDITALAHLGLDNDLVNTQRMQGKFFAANYMTQITNIQHASAMAGGIQWMQDMISNMRTPRKDGRKSAYIEGKVRSELRELGVVDEAQNDFMDWVMSWDTVPTMDQLDTPMGQLFGDAMRRFVGTVIQHPTRADKPLWASTPYGRLVYQFTSFMWAFYSNITRAAAVRGMRNFELAKDAGYTGTEAFFKAWGGQATTLLAGYAASTVLLSVVQAVTMYLFNREQWDKYDDDDERMLAILLGSAFKTGALGPVADSFVNLTSGIRYGKDAINFMAGPGVSAIFQDAQMIIEAVTKNSPNTNTAERKALKAVGRMIVQPLLAWALTSMNINNPIGQFGRFSALFLLQSGLPNMFAELAGPAEKR